jgi:hypothetical protein
MEFILLAAILLIVLLYRLNASKIKGAIGESKVARQLRKLPAEEYIVFNDVFIKTNIGSSQLDHIVISIYGIFVIETKYYTGWIHGNENSEYWTQTIYKKKTEFRNPIKQNWSHIFSLKEVLSDFKQIKYYPVVIFAGSAELKNIYSKTPVIYDYQLLQTLMNLSKIPVITITQVNHIADRLNKILMQDNQKKKEHIYQIQNHVYERKKKEKSLICPSCGESLVVRDGPYGKFFGCADYPKCKYKRKYK